jgi:hypothetical protein
VFSIALALEICVSGSKISEAATRFPVCVASAGDQDPAIGERDGGLSRAREDEVIELLDL